MYILDSRCGMADGCWAWLILATWRDNRVTWELKLGLEIYWCDFALLVLGNQKGLAVSRGNCISRDGMVLACCSWQEQALNPSQSELLISYHMFL